MKEFSYDLILDNLDKKKNFSFARYGDGELNCIFGKEGRNCDQHNYSKDLGARLKEIASTKREYYMGLQNLGAKQNAANPEFQKLLTTQDWVANDVLHHASKKKNIDPFFKALMKREVLLVGNPYLDTIYPQPADFILTIPEFDCWSSYEVTLTALKKLIKKDMVVLYCASMMSEVLIDDMYKTLGNTITQIDCGSVFDPYCKPPRDIRTYHGELIETLNE